MPTDVELDWKFRPATYWDPDLAAIANIKGDIRRACLMDSLAGPDPEDEHDEEFRRVSLSEQELEERRGRRPGSLGGEYLPDYLPDEVEIARITLDPAIRRCVAVRARPVRQQIRYRVVCDHGARFVFSPASSDQPLTLEQIAQLLCCIRETDQATPLIESHWLRYQQLVETGDAIGAIKVSSLFYPQLTEWYFQEALAWGLAQHPDAMEDRLTDDQRVDPAYVDDLGWTALHHAARYGRIEHVRQLIEQGADVNAVIPILPLTPPPSPPCGFSTNRELVHRFYDARGYLSAAQVHGSTPLHLAVCNAHEPVIRVLMDAGARSAVVNAAGYRPIDLARRLDHQGVIRLLEEVSP